MCPGQGDTDDGHQVGGVKEDEHDGNDSMDDGNGQYPI